MTDPVDPVTLALTGHLPFDLLVAAVLTWPTALALLWLYTRAVRRSMRSHTPESASSPPSTRSTPSMPSTPGPSTPAALHDLHDVHERAAMPGGDPLFARLMGQPRRAAVVYAAGGSAYAVVMASATLLSDGMEILPMRLVFLFWMFAWPIVLTLGIVSLSTRTARLAAVVGYFTALSAISALAMLRSPDLTWGQVFLAWALYDLPPTVLLVTYLSRGVRAVGPLVLTFMLLSVTGSDLAVSIAGSRDSYLRAIIAVTDRVGLGGTGTFAAMLALGFVMFAAVGWLALGAIRGLYQAKQIGDESVTVDALWLLFAIVHSMDLVFEHPLWALASLVALGAYKGTVRAGFAWLGGRNEVGGRPPVLLVLRSFSIGSDGERLFEVIERFWRRAGSIQMISGIDLARHTVEPHEFLDFISGKLARRFIDGADTLEQRMQERDLGRDQDLRFRVNDFFCYDDTWRMVLSRLVNESDAVLMDLRGFSPLNAGCVFELRELVRLVRLARVVLIVDRRTDEALLAETLGDCRAGVFRLAALNRREIRPLMRALSAAALPLTPAAP
jgi:hypothetical protein